MVQAEFNSSTFSSNGLVVNRKVYTMEDVEKKCKIWPKSNQMGLDGWPFFSYKNIVEVEWVKAAIVDALNKPELFGASDTYGALCNLKEKIKGKNAEVLRETYGIPPKLEYRNNKNVNQIVDANHNDELVIPLTASEILDVIADLNKNRSIDEIMGAYDFHHNNMNRDFLKLFHDYYKKGMLNKLIKYICSKSNELGGFKDYGVDDVRNRLTSQYLCLQRCNGGDGK